MTFRIVYFSGTGCTRYVANTIADELQSRNHVVQMHDLKDCAIRKEKYDMLIVCFVVHACNAPEPVMNWIKAEENADDIPAVVISVSGGGEVTPNLACRVPIKRLLKRKKFKVFYEKMIVMPSNWIVATKTKLIRKLIEVLPFKISFIVEDILKGNKHRTHPLPGNRLFTLLGSLEKIGAHFFGKNIHVGPSCSGCGLCSIQCPVHNIQSQEGYPIFGNTCIMCLNCIYSCPHKALIPKIGTFFPIKSGFNLNAEIKRIEADDNFDLNSEARGFLWLGVKRYLSNKADMFEPKARKNSTNILPGRAMDEK